MEFSKASSKGKALSLFSLMMINVIAVDSLRSLTAGAEYGFSVVFFYLLAALLFFVPTILVTAELATGWPNTGGVYVWVREAFGPRMGFLTIWLQWIYNVVWYPTIFAFIAGVLAYLLQPSLVDNKLYMIIVILTSFWLSTLVNCLGLKSSQWLCVIGAIVGTIVPMLFITLLGAFWLYQGKPSQVHFTLHDFFPNLTHLDNLAFLTNILFGLMGMEMSAVHAGDVKNPKRDYPLALCYSAIIIIVTLVLACLAITVVIPSNALNLVSGLMDAYAIFFNAFHLRALVPLIAILIILGALSGATAWIIGPARGLMVAAQDSGLPKILTKQNRHGMPVGILLTQGVVVTLLCLVFLIMPSVNSSYWFLSNLTAQLALLFYILMFAAAIRLRRKHPDVARTFTIPGGSLGLKIVCAIGMLTCIAAVLLGFLPPAQMGIGRVGYYEAALLIGMLIFCAPAWLVKPKQNSP